MSGDTIPIREHVDSSALESYLTGRGLLNGGGLAIDQFGGGHSNLTYLLRSGRSRFVLRRPPFGPVPPKAHDMVREARILSALHPVFPLAPKPLLVCDDGSVLGVPFYLMEHREGVVIRQADAPVLGDDPELRRRAGEAMLDALIALHAVDARSPAIRELGRPEGFLDRQVNGWYARWERAQTREIEEMNHLVRWLFEKMPRSDSFVVLHNDFKADNVMVDNADPSRLVAVLDWEMSALGDPLIDLGILLCYWPQHDDPPERRESISPVTATPGWPRRADLVERYARATGRDVSAVAYYEVFALFKVAVVLQQIFHRYHIGQTNDVRFASLDKRVQDLIRSAIACIATFRCQGSTP
jgi:aminoglycoside phosphotransferase (APT) family kinase protein